MKCPRCGDESGSENARCPGCDALYDAASLEEYAHLEYLQNRLFSWNASGELSPELTARLLAATRQDLQRLEAALGLVPSLSESSLPESTAEPSVPACEEVALDPRLELATGLPERDTAPAILAPAELSAQADSQAPLLTPVSAFLEDLADRLTGLLPLWGALPTESLADVESATDALLTGPEEAVEARKTGASHRDWTKRLAPAGLPPVFTGRDFSWRQIGTYLLSERTMHGLLALGTFLVLASGFVISTLNPTHLPLLWHLCVVALTTIIFFSVGYVVRFRLHLSITGSTLMAIGGAFIPLTIATLGRDELLNWETGATWLIASLVSLPIFLAFHILLRDRAFALFTALAGGSELLATTNWLGVSGEWAAALLVALAIGYVRLGNRVRRDWSILAWALFWVAQTSVPIMLGGLRGSLSFPVIWQVFVGREPGGSLGWGVAAAWWLGALFYWLSSTLSDRQRYQFAAAWSIPFAYLFTVDVLRVDPAWYNFWLALLPAGYALFSLWRSRRRSATPLSRLTEVLADPVCQAGLAATLEAVVWPNQSFMARGPSLAIAALAYAVYALEFKGIPLFRYVASYLLPLAVGLSLAQLAAFGLPWFQPPWQGLELAVLAACYLLVGWYGSFRRSSSSDYHMLLKDPVYQVALALAISSALWPWATRESFPVTYLALSILFAAATNLLRTRATAYVSAVLLLMACGLCTELLELDMATAALGYALLAAAMVGAAELLARRSGEATRPLLETVVGFGEWRSRFASPLVLVGHFTAITAGILCLGAFAASQSARPATLVEAGVIAAGVVVVAVAALSSASRRSSLFLYLAVVLFLVPYLGFAGHVAHWLGRPATQAGAAVLLSILGAVYVGVAALTDRFGGHYSKPTYLAGYTLSALAMMMVAGDRSSRVLTVGVALLVYGWSAWRVHRGRHPAFEWFARSMFAPTVREHRVLHDLFLHVTAWLFPLWVALAISFATSGAHIGQYGLVAAVLAPAYVATGLRFRRIMPEYRWPWYLAGYALSGLGPLMALGLLGRAQGYAVYRGQVVPAGFDCPSLVVTLGISIVLFAASFKLFDQRPWLFLGTWLSPVWVVLALSLWGPAPPLSAFAIVLSLIGPIYAAAGRRFERLDRGYRWPWYLAGYALSVVGPSLAWLDAVRSLRTGLEAIPYSPPLVLCLLASVALYAASSWVSLRSAWLWVVAVLFPMWLLLALRLLLPASPLDPYGVALAVLAVLFIGLSWRVRGFGPEYQEPWFFGAYVLSGLGPLLTLPPAVITATGPTLLALSSGTNPFLISLSISTLLYLTAARPLRQPGWLYAGAALLTLLTIDAMQRLAVSTPTYGMVLLLLALAYGVAGTAIHHGSLRLVRYLITGTPGPYALPFFVVGHIVTVMALGHLLLQGGQVAVNGFLLGSLVYIGSARIFRKHEFMTPAAVALAIVYVYGLSVFASFWEWQTSGMLPGIAIFLVVAQALRLRLGFAWGKAFFVIAYIATPLMVLTAGFTSTTWYQAWWGAVLVFAVSTWLFRSPWWLYPTLLNVLGAYVTTLDMLGLPPSLLISGVALIGLLWLFSWAAHLIAVKTPASHHAQLWPGLGTERIWSHRWASPFAISALIVFGLSAMGSAADPGRGLVAALSYTLLVAPLAVLWAGEVEAWFALGFAVVAVEQWERLVATPAEEAMLRFAALALLFGVLAIVARAIDLKGVAVWRRPLSWGAAALGAAAPVFAATAYYGRPSGYALQALAMTVSTTGLTMVALGFAHRLRFLGYLGVAVVEGGYMLELSRMQVGQPQAFALPAGIYLLVIAFLEWRRGEGTRLKRRTEQAGITLLLGVSLVQAIGQLGAGHDRYFYDTFLFCESLALLGLGAVLRWKRTFLWAANALVIDVFIMLADPIRAMNTWYLLAFTGSIMIAIVVFTEQRRQQIPGWIDEWRQRLEAWD